MHGDSPETVEYELPYHRSDSNTRPSMNFPFREQSVRPTATCRLCKNGDCLDSVIKDIKLPRQNARLTCVFRKVAQSLLLPIHAVGILRYTGVCRICARWLGAPCLWKLLYGCHEIKTLLQKAWLDSEFRGVGKDWEALKPSISNLLVGVFSHCTESDWSELNASQGS